MKIVKLLQAEEDLIGIWLYISRDNPRAADALLDRIAHRIDLLATQPRSGAPRADLGSGLRQVVVPPYLVLYRIVEDVVEIVRVLHGKRDISSDEFSI